MSDSETTQVWDEGEELDNAEMETDFSSALSSLGAHLQEQELMDDELAVEETSYSEEQALLETDYPAYEDAIHEPSMASEFDALDAALAEEDDFGHTAYAAEPAAAVVETPEEEYPEEFSASFTYASVESSEDEPVYSDEEESQASVVEEVVLVEEVAAPADPAPEAPAPTADMTGAEHFNLTTLTGLIDEIRAESDRVHQMKESVSKALSLIQEMAESLKS